MVNFWALDSVPEQFRLRNLHVHNPQVTLMRITPDEGRQIGARIAGKLNACEGPLRFLIPEKGVSALDIAGGPFFDPEADAALFEALDDGLRATSKCQLIRLPLHINDPDFSHALVDNFLEIAASGEVIDRTAQCVVLIGPFAPLFLNRHRPFRAPLS